MYYILERCSIADQGPLCDITLRVAAARYGMIQKRYDSVSMDTLVCNLVNTKIQTQATSNKHGSGYCDNILDTPHNQFINHMIPEVVQGSINGVHDCLVIIRIKELNYQGLIKVPIIFKGNI